MAAVGMKLKKKHVVDRRDGMNDETRRHFENVKRKMFAFIHGQQRMDADGVQLAAAPVPHSTPERASNEPKMNPTPHHRHHHHHHHHRRESPDAARKHFRTPKTPHRQPQHLPFATPQVAHRLRK